MRLRACGAQPIPEIAVRILIEIDDVGAAAIDRKIARPGRADISVAGRGPTEQVLRAEIREACVRSKTNDLINFVLRRTLRVVVARAGRTGELKRVRGIECNDSIIRTAQAAVCRHRRWRVQPHCSPARARRLHIRG